VIPYIGAPQNLGKKILVAWNASREASRAVADAMPMLEAADSVEVFAVEPNGMGDAPGADIAAHLARHGINATANKTTGLDIDVGDVLLNQAADSGADLIVMGGYGHSRMRELVLGGATRHILEHMTVPVLLSH
jgi:nucleotide-binding universal stress UspA family protein